MVLPGGLGGSKQLAGSQKVKEVLDAQEKVGGFVAAVCAAPIALMAHGIATVFSLQAPSPTCSESPHVVRVSTCKDGARERSRLKARYN